MAKSGKRLRNAKEKINLDGVYTLTDAVKIVKENANTNFDETIDIALNLGVDPKHADQMVRGVVSLPHGTGKTLRVAVFARGDKIKEAQNAGADLVGSDELADQIKKGIIDFDRVIATPDMMAVVGQLGKVLGPKGLMPNPKLGTVTLDVAAAVKSIKGGQIEFRTEKTGIIHAGVGKASFSEDAIGENVSSFIKAINMAKPSGVKGAYLKRITISSSMGPGVKLDINNFAL